MPDVDDDYQNRFYRDLDTLDVNSFIAGYEFVESNSDDIFDDLDSLDEDYFWTD